MGTAPGGNTLPGGRTCGPAAGSRQKNMPRGARETSWATRPEPSSVGGAAPGRLRCAWWAHDGWSPPPDLACEPKRRGRPPAVPVGNLFGTCWRLAPDAPVTC